MPCFCRFSVFIPFFFAIVSLSQVHSRVAAATEHKLSPFEAALTSLQAEIGYDFKNIGYLRRAMTHASFSEENNKALSILGANVIDASVSIYYLEEDIDISSKDINRKIAETSKVETSCAVDGMRLGLHKVVRVSSKTNATAPALVCGVFRAIIGAVAIDTDKVDRARAVFWNVHGLEVGRISVM